MGLAVPQASEARVATEATGADLEVGAREAARAAPRGPRDRTGEQVVRDPEVQKAKSGLKVWRRCSRVRRSCRGTTPTTLGVAGGVIARCALLEHAKLVRAVLRRDVHLRDDTRPPFLLRLMIEIDDLHAIAPWLQRYARGRVCSPVFSSASRESLAHADI